MSWSGGTYKKGNFTTNGWTGDASLGIGIEAGRHDTQDDDFAAGINQCLNKDGSNAATGNLNAGAFRVTNIGAGTARSDAAQVGQIQDGTSSYLGTTAGTATAFTVTATPTITALVTGAQYRFKANAANGVAATLKIDGTTATTMQRQGTALVGNEFKASDFVSVVYDGTNFQITNVATAPLYVDRTNNRVGIGTTTPKDKLQLGALTTVTPFNDTAAGFGFNYYYDGASKAIASANRTALIQLDNAGGSLKATTGTQTADAAVSGLNPYINWGGFSDLIQFYTNNLERMRITSAGRVGIGTTGPGSILSIINNESNSVNTGVFQSNVAGDASTHALIVTKRDNNSTTGQVLIGFLMNSGVTGQGQINANGASQAAFGSFSDERLKENIEDLPSQLVNMLALRPVEFDYKNGDGHQIGFIAQEVEQIYPDLVSEAANGFLTLSGLGKNEARMIKAFQEFAQLTETKIAALEARIAALEA